MPWVMVSTDLRLIDPEDCVVRLNCHYSTVLRDDSCPGSSAHNAPNLQSPRSTVLRRHMLGCGQLDQAAIIEGCPDGVEKQSQSAISRRTLPVPRCNQYDGALFKSPLSTYIKEYCPIAREIHTRHSLSYPSTPLVSRIPCRNIFSLV